MQSPEGVASRVWIDVASSIGKFEGDEDDRWFSTTAHQRSVDEIRRSNRHDKMSTATDDAIAASDGADDDRESATALNRTLALPSALPPDHDGVDGDNEEKSEKPKESRSRSRRRATLRARTRMATGEARARRATDWP